MEQAKLTHSELMEKLYNLDIPEEELAPYLMVSDEYSTSFAPVIVPNPDLVDMEGEEGAVAVGAFNSIARWRRKQIYKKRLKGWEGVRIVSEGDSWFQYPLLLKDVIDHLMNLKKYKYAIYSLGEAGDLLANMRREDEITEAVERENPHVLLISGGGNDMVGGGRMAKMVHPGSDNITDPAAYPNEKFREFLEEIEGLYREMFTNLLRDFPSLKIVCHGYDYAIPDKGRWLGKPLEKAGIRSKKMQRDIVAVMINRFNESLKNIVAEFPGSVFHVNVRGTVDDGDWHDELHPDSDAFGEVAALFDETIKAALAAKPEGIALEVAPGEAMVTGAGFTLPGVQRLGNAEFERLVYTRARAVMGDKVEMPETRRERKELERDISDFFEKVHKEANFLPSSFLEKGVARAHSVCRIVAPGGFGSGFLIASRDFLMTNNHVLPTAEVADGSTAQFDYDEDDEEFRVELDPDRLFLTNKELDYTIVALKPHTLPDYIGAIELLRNPATVTREERVNVIQHPQARRKEISLHDNKVTYVYDRVIHYTTDTEPGSSGSPVFNNDWQLVALHHAGWSEEDGGATNEGVRISAIVEDLTGDGSEAATTVVEALNAAAAGASGQGGGAASIPPSAVAYKARRGGAGEMTVTVQGSSGEVYVRIN